MDISDLIKQATDILAQHGDLQVDIEVKDKRFYAKGLEIQSRNSTSEQVILVIYGNKDDDYR